MSYSETLTALVLKTYDVGEADRYCILFSLERGRLGVRAKGVRRLKSRMGGSLIPFQHVTVGARKSDAGYIAAGATPNGNSRHLDLRGFSEAVRGFEVLLKLTQDGEPFPAVFTASLVFLRACEEGIPHASLAYTLRLLHLFGFLPDEETLMEREQLPAGERELLHLAREGYFVRTGEREAGGLERMVERLVRELVSTPLKVPGVVARMGGGWR